jgi:hypothetical protein
MNSMHRTAQPAQLVAVVLAAGILAAGCSSNSSTGIDATGSSSRSNPTNHATFCRTMKQVTDLLDPNTGSMTPAGTKARYESLSILLDHAHQSAPPALAPDVATFATAIHRFTTALAKDGYHLDAIYKTPGGEKLAADTSHALTAAIVNELTGPCGIDLGPSRAPN